MSYCGGSWSPIFFGGFLRDLMIFGFSRWLRDIDIVMTLQSTEGLERELSEARPRRNLGLVYQQIKKVLRVDLVGTIEAWLTALLNCYESALSNCRIFRSFWRR